MPTRPSTLLCSLSLVFIASGCSSEILTGKCAAPAPRSVVVSVRDSVSGRAAADNAIGTLVGVGVDDTLFHVDSLTLEGGTQLGTFTVRIDKPGFLTWIADSVMVTQKGPCGNVLPVQLTARLQPATP
jgi:hypothetical protein